MTQNIDRFTVTMAPGQNLALSAVETRDGITFYRFHLTWTEENAARDDAFTVSWTHPIRNILYKWDASLQLCRNIYRAWDDNYFSMISSHAPLTCFFDGSGNNACCWSLDECRKYVHLYSILDDRTCLLTPRFTLPVRQYTGRTSADLTLRIDTRPVTLRQAVADTADWWENDCGMTPAYVPAAAKDPAYSFWYSFHQDIHDEDVVAECRRAKALGFDVCIVDDGWQTEDSSGGYAYTGDWEPAPGKFPNMAAHVAKVHDIGMKYILWYSVPFVGYYSKHYEHFRSMMLYTQDNLKAGVLDPRYKEVRDFLAGTYEKALREWNLDGFKLDFIDSWRDGPDNAPYNEKMDIPALQDAVDVCMAEIMDRLKAIKPDILLEFREAYIGPHMKRFGNMFRVGDCPGDFIKNRVTSLDLRMLMGDQAVHSDMLMFTPEERPENDALQIISVMFSVMQYSARLDRITPETARMSKFWLDFLKAHKSLLQSRNLRTYEPHLLYTWAQVTEGRECAAAVYAIDKCIRPDPVDTLYLANGCACDRMMLELEGTYQVRIFNCYGDETAAFTKAFDGISTLPVPMGGLAILEK